MKIYLAGIGGIGMSAYAAHMHGRGHTVLGSDKVRSETTDSLHEKGIEIFFVQDGSHVAADCDLFVYSEAVPTDSPERTKAQEYGIRQLSYFQALGELTEGTTLIAICGSHGKSTTTAMAARMLLDCGHDPSVVVGTKMHELEGANWRKGGDVWVVEACEYRRSFLALSPRIIIVTNIEDDHFDAFPTKESYDSAYADFFARLPKNGVLIYHGHDERSRKLAEKSGKKIIDADTQPMLTLRIPGEHMRQNVQLALALAKKLDIEKEKAKKSLQGYAGSWRRIEEKGRSKNGALIIDDYAHHPTEIIATLKALREKHTGKRLICLFQPHTHNRTMKLWNEFAAAFCDADIVLLTDVYDARPDTEKETADMTSLAGDMTKKSKTEARAVGDLKSASDELKKILSKNDVLVVMGAGDVTTVATALTQA